MTGNCHDENERKRTSHRNWPTNQFNVKIECQIGNDASSENHVAIARGSHNATVGECEVRYPRA